ncbi:MAG TPA: isoprenylcysteine carboxylmethyltransferase family protein [Gemmatimonadaceae bacterium]|nr:isoprenylcysteine carboxylmethyltransferase family protein [Gemmatimonadaceae bacterium]
MAEEKDAAGVVAPPPVIFAVPLAAAVYENTSHAIPFATGPVAMFLGIAIIVAGLFLFVAAVQQFKKAGTEVVPYRPTTAIIEVWPYSFSRNPIYLSMAIMYIGISLIFNTWWPIFLLPLVLLVIQRGVILREEAYLTRKFGDTYLSYKQRVRRWF